MNEIELIKSLPKDAAKFILEEVVKLEIVGTITESDKAHIEALGKRVRAATAPVIHQYLEELKTRGMTAPLDRMRIQHLTMLNAAVADFTATACSFPWHEEIVQAVDAETRVDAAVQALFSIVADGMRAAKGDAIAATALFRAMRKAGFSKEDIQTALKADSDARAAARAAAKRASAAGS